MTNSGNHSNSGSPAYRRIYGEGPDAPVSSHTKTLFEKFMEAMHKLFQRNTKNARLKSHKLNNKKYNDAKHKTKRQPSEFRGKNKKDKCGLKKVDSGNASKRTTSLMTK